MKPAATTVFLRKGYAEAKIIDIANEAQISPSTIYLYFDGKKQLFASLNIPEVAQLRPNTAAREEITRVALTLFGERDSRERPWMISRGGNGFFKAALYQYCASKEDLFFSRCFSCTPTPRLRPAAASVRTPATGG